MDPLYCNSVSERVLMVLHSLHTSVARPLQFTVQAPATAMSRNTVGAMTDEVRNTNFEGTVTFATAAMMQFYNSNLQCKHAPA